jgi:hypothetical protein
MNEQPRGLGRALFSLAVGLLLSLSVGLIYLIFRGHGISTAATWVLWSGTGALLLLALVHLIWSRLHRRLRP